MEKGIADVFDALTIIRDKSGSRFDPVFADAFVNCADEIIAIREEYPN